MTVLGIDYGDARTGVAVSDASGTLATGVCVLIERRAEVLADKIAALAAEKGAGTLVLGLPKNMDGSCGFRAEACRAFGALLAEKTGLPLVYRDERLTTVQAHRLLNDVNVRGKKRKNVVDAVAAELILQDYLDSAEKEGKT